LRLLTGDAHFVMPDLASWYRQKFGEASSLRELESKSEELVYPVSQLYTEEEVYKVEQAFPDKIMMNGRTVSLRYKRAENGELEILLPPIEPEDLLNFSETKLPTIVGLADQPVTPTITVLVG
jgi:hypothetical protein